MVPFPGECVDFRVAAQPEVLRPLDTTEWDRTWPELVVTEILNRPARAAIPPDPKRRWKQSIPIDQKESMRWWSGLRQAHDLTERIWPLPR
jgi:hypothetical protein